MPICFSAKRRFRADARRWRDPVPCLARNVGHGSRPSETSLSRGPEAHARSEPTRRRHADQLAGKFIVCGTGADEGRKAMLVTASQHHRRPLEMNKSLFLGNGVLVIPGLEDDSSRLRPAGTGRVQSIAYLERQ